MKRENTNRVNMLNTVIKFCDDSPGATAGIPAWAPALAGLKTKMTLINSYNQTATGKTSGVTKDTGLLREAMTEIALKCGNATLGFANSVNNNTLKALVDFVKGKLDKMAKETVDDTCQAIHDATNANIAGAGNYGVTPVDVTDLQAAIDIYRTHSQKPRMAIVTKSQANKQASKLVREAIDIYLIGQMDAMVNTLKISNNVFWQGYRQARMIINLGSTTAKVRGTCVREDGGFLANVTFTIYETETNTIVKQVITNVEGKFNAAKLSPGDFDFKWELEGYVTVSETNVHIVAGKELQRRKVVMKANDE